MFDYIICEYPLPAVELKAEDGVTMDQLQKEDYQTKSLDRTMLCFTIEADGRLSHNNYPDGRWVEAEAGSVFGRRFERGEPVKVYDNGNYVIDFYTSFENNNGPTDLWIEWQAIIFDGKLAEISLKEFERNDNSFRKESVKKYEEFMQRQQEFRKSAKFKYFFCWFNPLKIKLVDKICRTLQRVISWLHRI